MPVPRVAIVGRPNVGKSSLLNLLAHERVAIVDPTPGVTRDRISILTDLESPDGERPDKTVEFTDTGGFGVYTAEGARYDEVGNDLSTLTGDIEGQIAQAVSGADLILLAIDTQVGITPQDEEIAKLLREQKLGSRERSGKLIPVRIVATKVDGPSWETHAYEFSALGFDEPLMCSSKTKYMRRDLIDRLYDMLPDPQPEDERIARADLRIAIIGKRNAGKSTLVNTLAGENRVIVSEIPGTTRDAIDVRFEMGGRSIIAIDTAGLRRKKSFQSQIEWYALDRAQRSIMRADVVFLIIDATVKISQVDEHLAQMVQAEHKPCVVVVNKWDLVSGTFARDGKEITPEHYETYLRKELMGLRVAPIAIISASEGSNIRATIDLAFDLHEQASVRVSTGKLNRLVAKILENRGPSSRLGTLARVYYAAQVRANPPTIVLIVNDPDLFTSNYKRYLMNRFREELPFEEVPIRLVIRERKRRDKGMMKLIETEPGEMAPEEIADMLENLPDDPDAYFDD